MENEVLAGFPTVHDRHIKVHQNEIKLLFSLLLDDLDRFEAVLCFSHFNIAFSKSELDLHQDDWVVIDS